VFFLTNLYQLETNTMNTIKEAVLTAITFAFFAGGLLVCMLSYFDVLTNT